MLENLDNFTLSDLGEFRLLNEIILPLLKTDQNLIGDDCAFIDIPLDSSSIVVTTDAGPKPLFYNEQHPYYFMWGWYTILANVSDLASAGCYPLAISLAVEAKPEMRISELKDYFNGAKKAATNFGIPISGGNIKSNTQFISNATAIGYLKKGQNSLTRRGARTGDIVFSIGDNGLFITSYLKYMQSGYDSLTLQEKVKIGGPHPQLLQMQSLISEIAITSASDNSDGILGALWNIAEKSNCYFELDFDSINLPTYIKEFAEKNNLSPWNVFLFWGDWQIIITITADDLNKFEILCSQKNISYTKLGITFSGDSKILSKHHGQLKELNILRNENFSTLSYNQGISNHIDFLLKSQLFKNEK